MALYCTKDISSSNNGIFFEVEMSIANTIFVEVTDEDEDELSCPKKGCFYDLWYQTPKQHSDGLSGHVRSLKRPLLFRTQHRFRHSQPHG